MSNLLYYIIIYLKMLKILILVQIIILSFVTVSKKYTCQFDKIYRNASTKKNPNDKPGETFDDYVTNRLLQTTITRQNIRITLDTTYLSTVRATSHGQDQTTLTNLNYLKKAIRISQYFFEQRLKVSRIARVFAPSNCIDFSPSTNDQSYGISSSDLHIYVRYITDSTEEYGATGKSCQWVTSRTLPDTTLQQGRPTIGRIVYNTYNIIDDETTMTNRIFASIVATSIHETIHILGFDFQLYNSYLDESTGDVYASTISGPTTLHPSRTDNYLFTTPKVLEWAQKFFACPSITGMPMQNEQGTGNIPSHWQRLTMYDQMMTATQLGSQKGISGLTFAMLKDMGWYEVDDTFNDTTNYGFQLGCTFFTDACYASGDPFPKYFCDTSVYTSSMVECATNFLGKAVCTDQAQLMSDGCGMFGQAQSCVDPANSGDSYTPYTLQKYKVTSFCAKSTFANVGITSNYGGRCYPYVCHDSSVVFSVGSYSVTCLDSEEGTAKTINSLYGSLQCPNHADFCTNSRKICKNWCSGNGFCTRGICNCYTGYYGSDCSIASCTSGEYYYSITDSCLTQCPSGTYENKYSKACQTCDSACDECRDQPTICTGCLSTQDNPQYFYADDNVCLDSCPSDTFTNGDYCQNCDATVFCASCAYAATNCTSCSGGHFLQNPTAGSCVPSCVDPNPNTIYDVVNMKCVSSCTDNLIYTLGSCTQCPNTGDGNCNLCPDGSFKLISNQSCVSNCPSSYYEDADRRFCQDCDSSCLQCDGPYAENCTQCSSSSNLKYLLLKMCVSSCPRGFFTNDDQNKCETCTISLNCATCQVDAGTGNVVCLTCEYGYYLHSDQTCQTTCDTYYYQNKWNHTCDACSTNCGDCTTSSDSSCTDCRVGKLFLANISGGYCVTQCPTELYVESGSNCLDCYTTCLTCNGVSSTNCLSCKDGLFLSEGMCRYVCPSGSYANETTRTCQPCSPSCSFCFGQTINNCTACISGLVLDNFTCTTSCSDNLTVNQWGVCFEKLSQVSLIFLLIIGLALTI